MVHSWNQRNDRNIIRILITDLSHLFKFVGFNFQWHRCFIICWTNGWSGAQTFSDSGLWIPNFLATDNQFCLMFLEDSLSTMMILSRGICFHLNKWTNVVRGVLSAMTLRFVRGLPGKRRLRIRSCGRARE